MIQEYVYLVRPRRSNFMESMTADEGKAVEEHFNYLKRALENGKLVLAGPCLDAAFGIVVFNAASQEEAEGFMANDPAIKAGVFSSELHPYKVSLIKQSV